MPSLLTVKANTRFKVHQLTCNGPDNETVTHLQQLGFLPGEEVVVQRRAQLGGGSVVVRIGASTFALRHSEAACIFVV
jgi:ferrous iron transport protein A